MKAHLRVVLLAAAAVDRSICCFAETVEARLARVVTLLIYLLLAPRTAEALWMTVRHQVVLTRVNLRQESVTRFLLVASRPHAEV